MVRSLPYSFLALFLISVMGGRAKSIRIPQIPNSLENESSNYYFSHYWLWKFALSKQGVTTETAKEIKTLISPFELNLIPMDAPDPLYEDKYSDLRTEFLLDYMLEEYVNPEDPLMATPEGLTANNFNGKPINFKQIEHGNYTVNGVYVETTQNLDEGIIVYYISDVLFDHAKRVDQAFYDNLGSESLGALQDV